MNLKHGRCTDPIYGVWRSMITRCTNPSARGWEHYGGRGISVCDRWRGSFPLFLADMGERPAGATLERVDNDGDYEPGNVVWASRAQQAANKRTTRFLSFHGREVAAFALAKEVGLPRDTLIARLRLGYSAEAAADPNFDSTAKRAALARQNAAARTHCTRGHELTAENTFIYSPQNPVRCCKRCKKEARLRRLGRLAEPAKPGCVCVTLQADRVQP